MYIYHARTVSEINARAASCILPRTEMMRKRQSFDNYAKCNLGIIFHLQTAVAKKKLLNFFFLFCYRVQSCFVLDSEAQGEMC